MYEQDNEEDDEKQLTKQSGEYTFLEKNKLSAMQKTLKRLSIKSLKFVEEVLDDKDNVYDTKTKMDCAKFATTTFVNVTDSIAKDQMGRLIAEVKVKGLAAKPNIKTIEENAQPKAVFTTALLDVDKLDEDYVPPEEGKFDASGWKIEDVDE